jgi:hypothetical protein
MNVQVKNDNGAGLWHAMISAKVVRDEASGKWRVIGADRSVLFSCDTAGEAERWLHGPDYMLGRRT